MDSSEPEIESSFFYCVSLVSLVSHLLLRETERQRPGQLHPGCGGPGQIRQQAEVERPSF